MAPGTGDGTVLPLAVLPLAVLPVTGLPVTGLPGAGTGPATLAASRNWPRRFHQRSRGMDASSSTRTPPSVTMPRTSSFVRMIDSSTTVPANRDAHRYMSRTLARCE
jgi:hypothetical protein